MEPFSSKIVFSKVNCNFPQKTMWTDFNQEIFHNSYDSSLRKHLVRNLE